MPYRIVQIPDTRYYHIVNPENGHVFSKHGLTYERALKQLRALYIHSYPRSNKIHPETPHINGSGLFDRFTLRDKEPPKVRKIFEEYKNYVVKRVYVCREPIVQAFSTILSLLMGKKFEEDKERYNIDKFFHLYTFYVLQHPLGRDHYIRLEKNEVISAEVVKTIPDLGSAGRNYFPPVPIKFGQVIEKTISIMGYDRFINYSIYTSNCQDFALSLAQAVLGTCPPDLTAFIKQDHVADLVPKSSLAGKIAETVTHYAGIFDHIFHGSGVVCKFCQKN